MDIAKARQALKAYFGYDQFRPMQAEIIENVFQGKDTLVLMPTGGGKSICFQVPAICMEGTGVVVSPLIALMKDQVESLKANGVTAAYLNSSQSAAEQREITAALYKGEFQLLYVSPEKLLSQDFGYVLQQFKVNLFAIDEAHCISAWGHDFRPEYTQLQYLKQRFPNLPIIACTATADKVTRKDIVKQLGLQQPEIFVASFDRPNLSLDVRPGTQRFAQVVQFLNEHPNQSGIIYCLSRKETQNLAAKLKEKGFEADYYHAGMLAAERSRVQEEFINDETPIVCATIAFGMGIDKPNVRWVIHYNMPKNLEGFYQEIGRAGRDGAAADTLLFYSYADVMKWKDIMGKQESNQNELKVAKLERMQQYATALFCRRKVLLNYFSEDWRENCGNCDVCNNPPQYFNGTIAAQKALSAIKRAKEQVGTNLLIDVLRGSRRREIYEANLHNIKTYGMGKEYSFQQWRYYIEQLVNQGYLEVAHDDKNKLKLTPASSAVLFEGQQVQLVKLITAQQREEMQKAQARRIRITDDNKLRVRDELFEYLRDLRRDISRIEGVPPYMVFGDVALEEMAANKPTDEKQMRSITGVGNMKWNKYGKQFLNAIATYCKENNIDLVARPATKPTPKVKVTSEPKVSTHQQTFDLYKQGLSLEEIATKRSLKMSTITTHFVKLYQKGEPIDLESYLTPREQQLIVEAIEFLEEPYGLSDIYNYFNGTMSYTKINFALAIHRKQQQ